MKRCLNCDAELDNEDELFCERCKSLGGDGGQTIAEDLGSVHQPTLAEEPNPAMSDFNKRDSEPPAPPPRTIITDKPSDQPKVDKLWAESNAATLDSGQSLKAGGRPGPHTSQLVVKSRHLADVGDVPLAEAGAPDYEVMSLIGEGGMGVVYEARQTAIDRAIAIKMIKPHAAGNADMRHKFLAEAAVTGELDHPNIVPIHDLGATEDGALFYAMKKVKGTPWQDVVGEKSLTENLDILMRVADAVACAHSHDVIHRDLKPENVMLGEFGEVLVMDWGLAASISQRGKAESIFSTAPIGGTPCYMAPEMATGESDKIGKHSDVYLLGGILYEIIGGKPPHSGENAMLCLYNAAENRIDPIEASGELVEIARKAMAADIHDRYPTVQDFQQAIREYQNHAESIALCDAAAANLSAAQDEQGYDHFAEALYGFKESLKLWDANEAAGDGLSQTRTEYARCALEHGDLDLAASLLDAADPEHQELLARVHAAQADAVARRKRLRNLTVAAAGLLVIVFLSITAGLYLVNEQKTKALAAERDARAAEKVATKQRDRAIAAEAKAVDAERKTSEVLSQLLTEKQKALLAEALAKKSKTELAKAEELLGAQEKLLDPSWWILDLEKAKAKQKKEGQPDTMPLARVIQLPGKVPLELVLVPSGEFVMGSHPKEKLRQGQEHVHHVRIRNPFYIGRYEVTQAQWVAMTKENPSAYPQKETRRYPVENVLRAEIDKIFLPTLNALAPKGWRFRLPTEAEWEYACRAGTATTYSSGSKEEDLAQVGWFASNAEHVPQPVGKKRPNQWGIYDMHGNVSEYCMDYHDPLFYLSSPVDDPVNLNSSRQTDRQPHFVIRGGGWINLPKHCRSAYRSWSFPDLRHEYLGLRVVLVKIESDLKANVDTRP